MQNSLSYKTSSLYNQYKNLTRYKDLSDKNNTGNAKISPIPIDKINSLSGTINILAWTTYADMDGEYPNTMNAISQYFTDYTVTTTTTEDASALEAELSSKDVFLIPEQEGGSSSEFSSLGSSWETVLDNFVRDGGIVILCGSSYGSEKILNSSGLMYLEYYDFYSSGSMNVVNKTHYITKDLPSSIPIQSATMFCNVTDTEADNLVMNNGYTSVAAKDIGLGHVVLVGYDYYAYDDNAAKIISNSAGLYEKDIIIKHNDPDTTSFIIPVLLTVDPAVGINDPIANKIPKSFDLKQNYPNPFNPITTIKYQLPKTSGVIIKVFNILGREVVTLINKTQPAGYYDIKWNGKNKEGIQAASGIYIYNLKAGNFIKTKKMLLIK
jgi:hypothetical protein